METTANTKPIARSGSVGTPNNRTGFDIEK
jgi:hypothetical protein